MKKLITLSLFILFALALTITGALQASETYGMCGARPGLLDRLFTDAEKIRIKCIEDIYEANKEKTRREVEQLTATSNKLGAELKKVAIKVEYNLVQCSPKRGEPERDPKLVRRCSELVVAQNAVISRIDELMGWSSRPRPKTEEKVSAADISPPCPSKEKLQSMQVARMFNRELFQTYERCVTMSPDTFY